MFSRAVQDTPLLFLKFASEIVPNPVASPDLDMLITYILQAILGVCVFSFPRLSLTHTHFSPHEPLRVCLYLLRGRGGQSSTTWKSVRLAFQPLPPGDGRGWGMLVTGAGESLWNKQRIPFCITGRLSLPGKEGSICPLLFLSLLPFFRSRTKTTFLRRLIS